VISETELSFPHKKNIISIFPLKADVKLLVNIFYNIFWAL